jgi:hypothetical protein
MPLMSAGRDSVWPQNGKKQRKRFQVDVINAEGRTCHGRRLRQFRSKLVTGWAAHLLRLHAQR